MQRINPNSFNQAFNAKHQVEEDDIDIDQARIYLKGKGYGFQTKNVATDKAYQVMLSEKMQDPVFFGRVFEKVMELARVISEPSPYDVEAYYQTAVSTGVELDDDCLYMYKATDEFNAKKDKLERVVCTRGYATTLPAIGDVQPLEVKPLLCEALNHLTSGVCVEPEQVKTTDSSNTRHLPQSISSYATPGVGVMQSNGVAQITNVLESFGIKIKPPQNGEAVRGNDLSSRLYKHLYKSNYSFLGQLVDNVVSRYPDEAKSTLRASAKNFALLYQDGDKLRKDTIKLPGTGFAPLLTPKNITAPLAVHFIGLCTTYFGGGKTATMQLANQSLHGVPLAKSFSLLASDVGDIQGIFNILPDDVNVPYISTKNGGLGLTAWKLFQKMRKYDDLTATHLMIKGCRTYTKKQVPQSDDETPLLYSSDVNTINGVEIQSDIRIILAKQSATVGDNPTGSMQQSIRAAGSIYKKIFKDTHRYIVVRGTLGLVQHLFDTRTAGQHNWAFKFVPSYHASLGSVIVHIDKDGEGNDEECFGNGFTDINDCAYLLWTLTRHAFTYRFHRVTWNSYVKTVSARIATHYAANKTKIPASDMIAYRRCMDKYGKNFFSQFPSIFIPLLTPEEASVVYDKDSSTDMEYSDLYLKDEHVDSIRQESIKKNVIPSRVASKPTVPVRNTQRKEVQTVAPPPKAEPAKSQPQPRQKQATSTKNVVPPIQVDTQKPASSKRKRRNKKTDTELEKMLDSPTLVSTPPVKRAAPLPEKSRRPIPKPRKEEKDEFSLGLQDEEGTVDVSST